VKWEEERDQSAFGEDEEEEKSTHLKDGEQSSLKVGVRVSDHPERAERMMRGVRKGMVLSLSEREREREERRRRANSQSVEDSRSDVEPDLRRYVLCISPKLGGSNWKRGVRDWKGIREEEYGMKSAFKLTCVVARFVTSRSWVKVVEANSFPSSGSSDFLSLFSDLSRSISFATSEQFSDSSQTSAQSRPLLSSPDTTSIINWRRKSRKLNQSKKRRGKRTRRRVEALGRKESRGKSDLARLTHLSWVDTRRNLDILFFEVLRKFVDLSDCNNKERRSDLARLGEEKRALLTVDRFTSLLHEKKIVELSEERSRRLVNHSDDCLACRCESSKEGDDEETGLSVEA